MDHEQKMYLSRGLQQGLRHIQIREASHTGDHGKQCVIRNNSHTKLVMLSPYFTDTRKRPPRHHKNEKQFIIL